MLTLKTTKDPTVFDSPHLHARRLLTIGNYWTCKARENLLLLGVREKYLYILFNDIIVHQQRHKSSTNCVLVFGVTLTKDVFLLFFSKTIQPKKSTQAFVKISRKRQRRVQGDDWRPRCFLQKSLDKWCEKYQATYNPLESAHQYKNPPQQQVSLTIKLQCDYARRPHSRLLQVARFARQSYPRKS